MGQHAAVCAFSRAVLRNNFPPKLIDPILYQTVAAEDALLSAGGHGLLCQHEQFLPSGPPFFAQY